jgi:hypothetical protein
MHKSSSLAWVDLSARTGELSDSNSESPVQKVCSPTKVRAIYAVIQEKHKYFRGTISFMCTGLAKDNVKFPNMQFAWLFWALSRRKTREFSLLICQNNQRNCAYSSPEHAYIHACIHTYLHTYIHTYAQISMVFTAAFIKGHIRAIPWLIKWLKCPVVSVFKLVCNI